MRTDEHTMQELWRLLAEYKRVCNERLGTRSSSHSYRYGAEQFVRWVDGQFEPGKNLPKNSLPRLEQPPQRWEGVAFEILMGPELDRQIDELFED